VAVSYLRRISTQRLIALCVALLVVAAGGAAIAIAATSGGPVPQRKPLANAVHDALAAPQLQGVTARIKFTNHLIDGVDLHGSNPVLSGATGRLWATKDGHFRLELQSSGGDAQAVSDGKSWWVSDGSGTVYRGTVPQDRGEKGGAGKEQKWQTPSIGRIQREINRVMQHASITGPTPTNVAGQPAYSVRMSPKRYGGLLGAIEFAWDANRGNPLRGAVYAKGSNDPVLALEATDISYGPVAASNFQVPPPAGAKVHRVRTNGHGDHGTKGGKNGRHGSHVTGLNRVKSRAGFNVSAPATLAGRQRQEVALVGRGNGRKAALVTYGRGLDGIAVIEKRAVAGETSKGPLAHAELPTVAINGVSGQELSTPLFSVVRFERGGISYVVLASAKHDVVETAARGL
jgi:outer membrane lipoprotein-sorting protein